MKHVKKGFEILGKSLLAIIMALVFIFAVMLAFGIISSLIGLASGNGLQIRISAPAGLGPYLQPVCFIAAVFCMYRWFDWKRGWPIGWMQRRGFRAFSEGMLWGIVLMTAVFGLIGMFGGYRITGIGFHPGDFPQFAHWFVLLVFVAVNEELLTRGYIQGLIRFHYGPAAGVTATSAIFASLHLFNDNVLQNPLPLAGLFLAGILLGISRELSGGLWMPIGLHFAWNLFQGNVFGYAVSGKPVASLIRIEPKGPVFWSGGGFGAEGSLAAVIVISAGILLVVLKYRTQKQTDHAAEC